MNIMKIERKHIIALLLVLVIAAGLMTLNLQPGNSGASQDEQVTGMAPEKTRKLSYSVAVRNPSNQVLRDVKIPVFVPGDYASWHETLETTASVPTDLQDDDLGNRLLLLKLEVLPPYAHRTVDISSLLGIHEQPRRTISAPSDHYLQAESYIESDHPDVLMQADMLCQKSDLETMRSLYEWLTRFVKLERDANNSRGALYTLQTKKGDISGMTYLYVALARACHLKARPVSGVVLTADTVIRASDIHYWTEVYLDGAWHIIDPARHKYLVEQSTYVPLRYGRAKEKSIVTAVQPVEAVIN